MAEIQRTVTQAIRGGRLQNPGTRNPVELLRGLGLLRDGILWRAAVVLFGNAERMEFEMPQGRLRGIDRMEFLDNRQFLGSALTLLAKATRLWQPERRWSKPIISSDR